MRAALLTALILSLLALPLAAKDIVQGQNGSWEMVWHGVASDRETSLPGLNATCQVVAEALDAAKARDFPAFCSCFWGVDSGQPPARVEMLFADWGHSLQVYTYSIGEEAVPTNTSQPALSNLYSAVSVCPASLMSRQTKPPERPPAVASVIFVQKRGDQWRLTPEVPDLVLERTMLKRIAPLVWRPVAAPQSGIGAVAWSRNMRLDNLRSNGGTPEDVLSMKESFQAENGGALKNAWKSWTNYYRAVVLDPPVVFERRDAFPINFKDPVSAFRSYNHALFDGDAATLLKYADASGRAWLKRTLGVDENVKKDNYGVWNNHLSHVTVLLTAETSIEGKDYALVFWRCQDEHNPTKGNITFQSTIFVRDGGGYLLTQALNKDSTFKKILIAANVRSKAMGFWPYPVFAEVMKKSDLPPSFYDVQ